MTTLRWGKKRLRGIRPGAASKFPAMRDPIKTVIRGEPGETEGLFLGYGMLHDSLPYAMFDEYDTETPRDLEFVSAVLENRCLRAEILPELGGRLWSLFDKIHGRELLLDNPELRLGNLAIRNAWFAGGVEWNCGRRGHDAQTVSPRFAAELTDGAGAPVLRIYEMSRDRLTPFQLDFMLPEDSAWLLVRGRIVNPGDSVVPMYWWSNIAVAEGPGARVVVPAAFAYANRYAGGVHTLAWLPLPDGEGFDGTRPANYRYVRDHFYDIPETSRKYECVFFEDGYGLAHCSTRRLQGRKLFVWGMSPGGRHWQRKLVPENSGNYIEIQAGLAKTQQESLPMPPRTAWEWMETYGAIQLPPDRVFGDWTAAQENTGAWLENHLPEARLESLLTETRETVARKPGRVVIPGSGWGALEEARRGGKLTDHLDFGVPGPEQREWLTLLKSGRMDDSTPPASWMVQAEWYECLKHAAPGWKTAYFRALWNYRTEDWERALAAIAEADKFDCNAWVLQARSNILRAAGHPVEAWLPPLLAAARREPDVYLVKEAMKLAVVHRRYVEALAFYDGISESLQKRPMLRFLRAVALAHTGNLAAAESIILDGGGLDLPDLREGETSIAELYVFIQTETAAKKGICLDPGAVEVPFALDLRMSAPDFASAPQPVERSIGLENGKKGNENG